eukprot:768633-Hanusia_phi.AAC.2
MSDSGRQCGVCSTRDTGGRSRGGTGERRCDEGSRGEQGGEERMFRGGGRGCNKWDARDWNRVGRRKGKESKKVQRGDSGRTTSIFKI